MNVPVAVAVREHMDITVAVLNNEYIGLVRQWQDGFYEGRRMASEYPWIPQFDKLAEAFGARGFRLEDQKVTELMKAWMKRSKSSLRSILDGRSADSERSFDPSRRALLTGDGCLATGPSPTTPDLRSVEP